MLDFDAPGFAGALGADAYDLVICHDALEYLGSPAALLREARSALAPGGRISLVVRNRSGEVLKRLFRGADLDVATALLVAERASEDMYGLELRLLDPAGLRDLVRAAGFDPLAECGVRVVADYIPDWMEGGDDSFGRTRTAARATGTCCTSRRRAAGGWACRSRSSR